MKAGNLSSGSPLTEAVLPSVATGMLSSPMDPPLQSLPRSLHPIILFPSSLSQIARSIAVAKRGLQTSRVPSEFSPLSSPLLSLLLPSSRHLPTLRGTVDPVWEKGRERCPRAARYVEQERNYYRRVTYSDVLPLVESSHILRHAHRHALGTMAWPQERFPYYANASALPALRQPCIT